MTSRVSYLAIALCAAAVAVAEEGGGAKLEASAGMAFGFTRIIYSSVRPRLDATDSTFLNGAWLQDIGASFSLTARVNPRFTVNAGIDGSFWHPLQTNVVGYVSRQGRRAAFGVFLFGNPDKPLFELTAGFFGFNYSPLAKDFGGYFSRNAVYPGFLYSGGAGGVYPGLRLNCGYFENLQQDLLITSEIGTMPYFDFSFAYMAAYDFGGVFELGAGVQLYRAIPVDREKTRPDELGRDVNNYMYTIEVAGTDTTYHFYRHSGTRVMLKWELDPKGIFGLDKLGDDDLKFYGEAAILGLKDYPKAESHVGYTNVLERIPVMAGFRPPRHPLVSYGLVPAALSTFLIGVEPDSTWFDTTIVAADTVVDTNVVHMGFADRRWRPYAWIGGAVVAGVGTFLLERSIGKVLRLDELAIEVEWYGSPYKNNPYNDRNPLPKPLDPSFGDREAHDDDWRWAVVGGKTFLDRITVSGKVASDHLRTRDENGWPEAREWLLGSIQWAWSLNVGVGF